MLQGITRNVYVFILRITNNMRVDTAVIIENGILIISMPSTSINTSIFSGVMAPLPKHISTIGLRRIKKKIAPIKLKSIDFPPISI